MKINLDKIIRSMSMALDFAEISSIENNVIDENFVGKVPSKNFSKHSYQNHSKITTYISLKIGEHLNLSENEIKKLYISSLLHDIGASNSLKKAHISKDFIIKHCEKGAEIISDFPVFSDISPFILFHHENYNGTGPAKMKGEDIPVISQIIRLADLVEFLYNENCSSHSQKSGIIKYVTDNTNSLFSCRIASAFLKISSKEIFWFDMENVSFIDFILNNISPNINTYIDLYDFEKIALIMAKIIDSKSSFTAKHSRGIAQLAYLVSKHIGYSDEKCLKMRIAGLLHDVGKLAIPNNILDKNGKLTDSEFSIIKSHVYYTKIFLDRIDGIKDISDWASNHHEKLNGTGYPRKLNSSNLSEECRIMCVCDIYQALTEDRPYRSGLSTEKAFTILNEMVSDGLICSDAFDKLKDTLREVDL
ncbi:MAG: HD domain-containing protein [Clostridium sp.]|nr:HD domain-containing protein [Clostridium sp.]